MADEQEDDLKKLVEQLINEKCIVIMEKLSTDLDYIELDISNHFYTNVIFYPKNLPSEQEAMVEKEKKEEDLIAKISKRIKKVIDATKNIRDEEIVLVPLSPDSGNIRSHFLHDDINIWAIIERVKQNTNFNSERGIDKLKEGRNVVVISFNFIGEVRNLPDLIKNKKPKLVKVIFILGIPPSIDPKLDGIDYDEIIPIEKVLDVTYLLLKPEKVGG